MMFCRVVGNWKEYADALSEATALNMRIACVSTAGLDPPFRRLTFLPEEIFLKPGEMDRPIQAPVNVREWLRDHT